MPSLHDTRLLNNLLKAEKEAISSFKAWSRDAASASAALSAWSVADSGDTQDLMDVSIRISQLLSACSDSQRSYVNALSEYRATLKAVLDKESAIKTVLRDREILVNRMIKLGNKKPADNALDSHQAKIEDAQRELTACETFLQDEEAALSGVKRESFREGLALRMRAMGELGRVMAESANEAIALLNQLGTDLPLHQHQFHVDDQGSNAGDSITPSHSASQALSRTSSSSSLHEPLTEPKQQTLVTRASLPKLNGSVHANSGLAPKATMDALAASLPSAQNLSASAPSASQQLASSLPSAASFTLAQHDSRDALSPSSARPHNSRRESSQSNATITSRNGARSPSLTGRPSRMGSVPRAARMPNSPLSRQMDLPRASDYFNPSDSDEPHGGSAVNYSQPASRLRKSGRAMSEGGFDDEKKRKSGFFSALGSIFKRKDKGEKEPKGWDTRIGQRGQRAGPPLDTSDEEYMPQRLVRVVNDPSARLRAMSDIGRAPPPAMPRRESRKAASEIGVSTGAASVRTARSSKTVTKLPPQVKDVVQNVVQPRSSQAFIPPPMRAPKNGVPVGAPLSGPPPIAEPAKIKKKKKAPVAAPPSPVPEEEPAQRSQQRETIVLSAEELFGTQLPQAVAASQQVQAKQPALVRSSTNASAATNTSAAKKKKKKTTPPAVPVSNAVEPARALPNAEDLSASLPSSRSHGGPAVLGGLDPYPVAPGSAPASPVLGAENGAEAKLSRKPSQHAPRVATQMSERNEHLNAVHGNGAWIHPTQGQGKPRTSSAGKHQTAEEGEQEQSLMALVESGRAEQSPDPSSPVEGPSRRYASQLESSLPSAAALPRATTSQMLEVPTLNASTSSGGLTKRKSVRMAEGSTTVPPASLSPPSSVRSAEGSTRPGILKRDASPSGVDNGEAGWNTRLAQRGGGGNGVGESDDSDSDAEEYNKARRSFAKGVKGMKSWSSGLVA